MAPQKFWMTPRRRKNGSAYRPRCKGGLLIGYSDGIRAEVYRVTGTLEAPRLTLVAATSVFDNEYDDSLRVLADLAGRTPVPRIA